MGGDREAEEERNETVDENCGRDSDLRGKEGS
jgi:hypothetical protein